MRHYRYSAEERDRLKYDTIHTFLHYSDTAAYWIRAQEPDLAYDAARTAVHYYHLLKIR